MELDELADDFGLAQHLSHGQHEIGRRDAFVELTAQMHADDVRREEIDGLSQHRRFGFDTTDAPADHAQAVDHRRMRIRSHQTVRVVDAVSFPNAFRQVLEIHLVANSNARRNNAKAIECLHAPLEKLISRVVSLELHLHVLAKRI